jgi:hypothetical protein
VQPINGPIDVELDGTNQLAIAGSGVVRSLATD